MPDDEPSNSSGESANRCVVRLAGPPRAQGAMSARYRYDEQASEVPETAPVPISPGSAEIFEQHCADVSKLELGI